MNLTLEMAEALVDGAKTRALQAGVAASIVVLDFAGHLKAFSRMDGAWLGSVDIAINKAWTARAFDMSTEQLSQPRKAAPPADASPVVAPAAVPDVGAS